MHQGIIYYTIGSSRGPTHIFPAMASGRKPFLCGVRYCTPKRLFSCWGPQWSSCEGACCYPVLRRSCDDTTGDSFIFLSGMLVCVNGSPPTSSFPVPMRRPTPMRGEREGAALFRGRFNSSRTGDKTVPSQIRGFFCSPPPPSPLLLNASQTTEMQEEGTIIRAINSKYTCTYSMMPLPYPSSAARSLGRQTNRFQRWAGDKG